MIKTCSLAEEQIVGYRLSPLKTGLDVLFDAKTETCMTPTVLSTDNSKNISLHESCQSAEGHINNLFCVIKKKKEGL
jgi:hypothetical protein